MRHYLRLLRRSFPILMIWVPLVLTNEAMAQSSASSAAAQAPSNTIAGSRPTVWFATLLRRKPVDGGINGLGLPQTKLSVVLMSRQGSLRPLVEVRGSFIRPGWKLYLLQTEIPVGPSGLFTIPVFLNGKVNELALVTKGPEGQSETERVFLYAPDTQEFRVMPYKDYFWLGVGLADLNYAQSGFGVFSSITGLLSLRYATPENSRHFGWSAQLASTLLTFSASPIDAGPQLVEGKLDLHYFLEPEEGETWHDQIVGGLSYLTLIPNGSEFGFANLLGPEVGWRGVKKIEAQKEWIGEAKWVFLGPLGDFSERGILLSIARRHTLPSLHRVEYGLNLSNYAYRSEPTTWVRTNLISIQFGYSL
jgi:hypothetical protein